MPGPLFRRSGSIGGAAYVKRGSAVSRSDDGRRAEEAVAHWMTSRGYAIVERNARVGRLELDIVARRGSLLVVCEVRSRRLGGVDPAWTFDARKRERIRRGARLYWLRAGARGPLRIDAAAVTVSGDRPPSIRYFENVFCDD